MYKVYTEYRKSEYDRRNKKARMTVESVWHETRNVGRSIMINEYSRGVFVWGSPAGPVNNPYSRMGKYV